MRYTSALLCLLFLAAVPAALAGRGSRLKSSAAGVHLTAVLGESLSLVPELSTLPSSMQPLGNGSTGQQLTSITTRWNLNADGDAFAVRVFFSGKDGAGALRAFPSMASMQGGETRDAGSLVFDHEPTPGKSDFSSRTDAVELPPGSECPSRGGDVRCEGFVTLVAVAY